MSEEDQTVDIMALPKFDMPSHESTMSAKDVKSLALRHGVPLDLHPVAFTKGCTMDKLPNDMIGIVGKGAGGQIFQETFSGLKGWKKRFFVLESRAIPDTMAWRYHDSDINDSVSEDGFMVTMSEYLRFPFLSGATIEKGNALTNRDLKEQHTVPPLLADQAIPDKTDHQKEAEVADPKIVETRERKARAAAKKREKKKSDPADPNTKNLSRAAANIVESYGNQSLHDSYHDSANHSVHEDQTVRNMTLVPTEVPCEQPMWCRELMIHLAPPTAQEESNALDNSIMLERAWFALGWGAWLKPTNLKDSRISRLIIIALLRHMQNVRIPFGSSWKLEMSHNRVQLLEGQNSGLSQVNKDQALKIKELEDSLARKDSALVYAERINVEGAREKERLVSQLKLVETFNLAIQAGWGKGLVEEHSEEELLGLMSRMENFDAYTDKRCVSSMTSCLRNDILMWRRFLAVFVIPSLIYSRFILTPLLSGKLLPTNLPLEKLLPPMLLERPDCFPFVV
nr:hypothetical protein [Tanacetum cinerariifolium]